MSRYQNYELIFMRDGRAIKFNSKSLREIKDVNQILININYDIKRLEKGRRYKVDGRYYVLRYSKGVIKVLDAYEGTRNKYFMADDLDVNVVDNEKLNSKLILEDSDDYLERNENREVVLRKSERSLPVMKMEQKSRKPSRSRELDSMRYDDREEHTFKSMGEIDSINDVKSEDKNYPDGLYHDKSPLILDEIDSEEIHDIDKGYYFDDVQKKEAPEFYLDQPRRYSKNYPRNINRPSANSESIFKNNISDEDSETRNRIIRLASYVDASAHRSLVLNDINTSIKTPKTIAMETGLRPNYVSKVLRDFKDRDIVVCINEEARKGKLYELTSMGLKVYDYLQ